MHREVMTVAEVNSDINIYLVSCVNNKEPCDHAYNCTYSTVKGVLPGIITSCLGSYYTKVVFLSCPVVICGVLVVNTHIDRKALPCELGILNHSVTHTQPEKHSCGELVLLLPLPDQYM